MTDDILGAIEATIARFRAGRTSNFVALNDVRLVMDLDRIVQKRSSALADAQHKLEKGINLIRG